MSRKKLDIVIIFLFFAFSFWLMFHTFGYEEATQQMRPATTVWSDFGSHLPLVRSFSMGQNWPPVYPLFPGEPIRYHFLFYAIVGWLEKAGLRIDWALNIPSALGFGLLLTMIYLLAKELFKSRAVGVLSVLFFLFNGTLAFVSYFNKNVLSWESLAGIITNTRFPSFGPWDGGLVSAFWNLNIYTNQRHLGLSFGLALLTIYLLWTNKPGAIRGFFVGLILGILLFTNQAALLGTAVFMGFFFLFSKKTHVPVLMAILTLIPFIFFYLSVARFAGLIELRPWYLLNPPINIQTVLTYWFHNLGLHMILIPVGFLLSPGEAKRFFLPVALLFILANMFQFSPDMINNHKFFNFAMIFGVMFTAWTIKSIFSTKFITIITIIAVIFLLTFSGIIDFFVVANDHQGFLNDVNATPDAQFFATRTPPDAVVLNSYWFYHPASLAGRSIYSGYAYFTWSYGYDKDGRERIARAIYGAKTKDLACKLLTLNTIDYVELTDKPEYVTPNVDLWRNEWTRMYRNDATGMSVYSVKENCGI